MSVGRGRASEREAGPGAVPADSPAHRVPRTEGSARSLAAAFVRLRRRCQAPAGSGTRVGDDPVEDDPGKA